jgi:hypothetical protein
MPLYSDSAAAPGANYSGSYPADAGQMTIPFPPRSVVLTNEDASLSAIVSFQGKDSAGANVDQVFLAAAEVKRIEDFPSPGTYDDGGAFSGVEVFLRAASGTPTVSISAEL